jgi:pyridoxamine 5'-phosphate oxidase
LVGEVLETMTIPSITEGASTAIADLRKDYTQAGLEQGDPSPFKQFELWFNQALAADLLEPNAMTLATVTSDGKPDARIVLLKGFDTRGFVFYTNYRSQKGQELAANPHAALVFLWGDLERQVRVVGRVEKATNLEADTYFQSRPLGSRLGAWASTQSEVILSREVLEAKMTALEKEYQGREIPRPDHWGGFRVMPTEIEFWQGRPSRLHDRLRYQLQANGVWVIDRLAP